MIINFHFDNLKIKMKTQQKKHKFTEKYTIIFSKRIKKNYQNESKKVTFMEKAVCLTRGKRQNIMQISKGEKNNGKQKRTERASDKLET